MRLKRLELFGFKSFYERTVIHFGSGITAIVGPNGSGKSNIADAILWVMGEQRPRSLRADRMEDVLFGGTKERKPLSMGEVSLILGEEESDAEETTLTRRLYRDGESEYLINRSQVRLKDMRDFLIDSGIGYHAHNILQQGKVEGLLTAEPEQRRELVDEIAGVAKWRVRTHEAQLKLANVEQRLAHAREGLSELGRRLTTLKRQAEKASRQSTLFQEQKRLDTALGALEYQEALQQKGLLTSQREGLLSESSAISARLSESEARAEQVQGDLLALQQETRPLREEVARLAREIGGAEALLKGLNERKGQLEEERRRAEEEGRAAAAESERFKTDLDRISAEIGATSSPSTPTEQLRENLLAAEQELAETRESLVDTAQRIASLKGTMTAMSREREEAAKRLTKKREEYQQAARDKLLAENRFSLARRKAELAAEEERRSAEAKEGVTLRRAEREASQKELQERILELRREEVELAGRLAVLKGQEELPPVERMIGRLAELLVIPQRIEKAVEAALAHRLAAPVVDGPPALLVEALKGPQPVRAIVIPKVPRAREISVLQRPGVLGRLSDLVSADPSSPQLPLLVSDCILVDGLEEALDLWAEGGSATLVTLAGEVIEPTGTIIAGPISGLLERRRAIVDLEGSLSRMSAAAREMETELRRIEAEILQLSSEEAERQEEIRRAQQAKLAAEAEANEAQGTSKRASYLYHTVRTEIEEVESHAASIEESEREREGDLSQLDQERTAHGSRLSALIAQTERLREEVDRSAREGAARDVLNFLSRDLALAEARREERETLASQYAEKITEAEEERRACEGKLTALIRSQEEAARKSRDAFEREAALAEKKRAAEKEIGQLHQESKATEAEIGRLNLSILTHSTRADQIAARLSEKYGADPAAIESEEAAREVTDVEGARARLTELTAAIEGLGPINQEAMAEHDQLRPEYEERLRAEADLIAARDDLVKIIQRYNREARGRFLETFATLNVKFAEVFAGFFGGGHAELILLDPDHPLESGVDLSVNPPGKQVKSAALSGGEKGLASISLLFAVFLLHPAPFCILDEVDAPLDEANIDRFARFIKTLAESIQFVMITHNKRTMEVADALYGISMEELGISRVISVRFAETSAP